LDFFIFSKKYISSIQKIKGAFFIFFLFFNFNSFAQYYNNKISFDKIDIEKYLLNDSLKPKSDSVKKFEMKKSPWTAVGLSAMMPGLGQLYNHSYWKIPVVLALGGYLGYEIVKNNNTFLDYRDKYVASQSLYPLDGDLILKQYREFYRDQRDNFILYFGLFYLINLVDAYVDAHLFDFNVSDKINFTIDKNKVPNLNIKINF
jgi:hypothetical protein